MVENQYFPLIEWPSLIFISEQLSAGSTGMEPSGTERRSQVIMSFIWFTVSLPRTSKCATNSRPQLQKASPNWWLSVATWYISVKIGKHASCPRKFSVTIWTVRAIRALLLGHLQVNCAFISFLKLMQLLQLLCYSLLPVNWWHDFDFFVSWNSVCNRTRN